LYNVFMQESAVSEAIRHARFTAGLSSRKLADAAGVNLSTISRAETGRRKPQGLTLYRLARAMGVDPRELLRARGDE
jgi:transcriptional regulator with XRE-family HTH domain